MALLEARGLAWGYQVDGREVSVCRESNLTEERGEVVSIVGRSGSGKSTLLYLLSGLEKPAEGEVWFDGIVLSTLSQRSLAHLRRRCFGFVYQSFNLIAVLPVRENIALPLYLNKVSLREASQRVDELACELEIQKLLDKQVGQLSGGEQQRVAIARALVIQPQVLFADEPTGSLDSITGEKAFELLRSLCSERGVAVLMVTHDRELARRADHMFRMADGTVGEVLK